MMSVSTIRELLVQAEKSFGPEDAIRYKIKKDVTEAKSYTDLREDSEKFSASLAELGAAGGHVAITGMTSYPWIVSFMGTVNSGSVAVPLDVSLTAEEMCELIDRADVTVLVLDEIRADVAAIVKDRCPKLKTLISMQKTEQDEQAYSFWQLLEKQEAGYSYEPEPDQLCTIMFTSGTTGKSKGVMLTHRNLAENATCLDMKIPPRTTILSVLPIHHAYCLSMDILKGISLGSIICINDSLLRVAKNIRLFQPDMIDLFESYGITILQGYGMTECAPVISTNVSWDIRKNSVGKLLPNCEAKVVDKELWVRGSSVMQGYYHMPEETKETLVDGWLRTGDLGYVDEDGFVYLTGRKKNLIITKNGENVSPEELENKIGEARLVQEILVREKEGVIEAEIFPDLDYVKKKRIKNVEEELQKVVDAYNQTAPVYKRVYKLKVREQEFEKTPSKKIKRY